MRGAEFLDCMEYVDADLVEAADQKPQKQWHFNWIPLVACVCLVAVSGLVMAGMAALKTSRGITIPEVDFKNPQVTASIGYSLVYQDRFYPLDITYSEEFMSEEEFEKILDLRETSIGKTDGRFVIPKEASDTPVSPFEGEVFTMKGYDPEFRLCLYREEEGEDGKMYRVVDIYEQLYGITLRTGKDYFEEKLHLSENWEDWMGCYTVLLDESIPSYGVEYRPLKNVSRQQKEAFIKALDECQFVDLGDQFNQFYNGDVEEKEITFLMKDGTKVDLTLFEGGWVRCEVPGPYMLQLPEEIFNTIYDSCG